MDANKIVTLLEKIAENQETQIEFAKKAQERYQELRNKPENRIKNIFFVWILFFIGSISALIIIKAFGLF